MGKGSELLALLKTGNSGEARKIINKLKKQGKKKILAVLNEQDGEGCTPLHYSAAYNFLDFIEDFLELGAVVDVEDTKGYTPLHLAATNGRAEAVSVLLCRGADPDIGARSGDTPIHLAAHNGHGDCVENLIREHAKCTMLNVSGQSPLDLACQNGHTEVVALLLRSGQFNPQRTETSQTSLKLAAKHGHTQVLSILIKHGFDVNRVLPGAHGTCLHEAALYGKIEAVHYLLQCGANPSIKNTQGLTPLDIVNHYTDPRSAQQLKQLLKDALAGQARGRMSQQYQQQSPTGPISHQRYSYSQGTHGQPSGRPQSDTPSQMSLHKQTSVPLSYHLPSMAELIAAKAASRRPMATSPTKRDDDDRGSILRSATLSGIKRPSIDRTVLQKRRNSYSDELGQDPLGSYNKSNPPTLPRRTHPPTFKPVPPPVTSSPDVNTQQQQRQQQQQSVPTPVQQPQLQTAVPQVTTPSLSDQIASIAEMRLKKVKAAPAPAPVEKEPSSLENELMAKLKRRQESITTTTTTTIQHSETAVQATTPTHTQTPPTTEVPPVTEQVPSLKTSAPSSPSKPAPKPKPKPSKQREEEPSPPRVLTWQEELAAKRISKTDSQSEKTPPPPLVKPKPCASPEKKQPPVVKTKPKPLNTTTLNEPPSIQPVVVQPHAQTIVQPQTEPIVQPHAQVTVQPQNEPIVQPHAQVTVQPQTEPIVQPHAQVTVQPQTEPIVQPHAQTTVQPQTEPIVQPRAQATLQPQTEPIVQPHAQTTVQPQTEPIVQPHAQTTVQPETRLVDILKPHSLSECSSSTREDNPLINRIIEDDSSYRPSTPSSDQMSRSTSISSIVSVPLSATPGLHHQNFGFECIPINDWLTSFKLSEYIAVMQNTGYDNTDFLLGITIEELTCLGVSKPGHRKRILSALNQLVAKEHYLTFKPASVAEWLQLLGVSQYESLMIDNGYDDIDFITSVSEEELIEIGINKKGHLKRLMKGIEELSDMLNSEQPTPSPYINSYTGVGVASPTHSVSSTNERRGSEPVVQLRNHPVDKPHPPSHSVSSSQDSGIDSNNTDKRQSGNFVKMKQMLEKRMGIDKDDQQQEEEDSVDPLPPVQLRNKGPPPVPKRSTSTTLSTAINDNNTDGPFPTHPTDKSLSTDGPGVIDKPLAIGGPPPTDAIDGPPPTDAIDGPIATDNELYTTDDINSVLDETPSSEQFVKRIASIIPELDDLDKALQGFGDLEEEELMEDDEDEDQEMLRKFEEDAIKDMEDELKTDQMLADIDNMLADLNTHLDIMIPPT